MYKPLQSPNYERPPITEAVIEFRVPAPISSDSVDKIAHRLKKRYDTMQDQHTVSVRLEATGGQVSVQQEPDKSRRLSTSDQAYIAVVNQNSLLTSCLAPYPGWKVLEEKTLANWEDWRHVIPAQRLARIGVRYINRLDIPDGGTGNIQMDKFFRIYPGIQILEQPLIGFLVQATLPCFLPKWTASITITPVVPAPVPKHLSVALDVDVFRTEDLPLKSADLPMVLREAQTIKNDLFERVLTDEAKELFKQ